MKRIGLNILIVGFIWLMFDTISSYTSYQHRQWIWQSKNLPAGEEIPRDDAVMAMRELSLDLKDRHRVVIMPAALMLIGGLLTFFARPRRRNPD
jgi:hypothetical protein